MPLRLTHRNSIKFHFETIDASRDLILKNLLDSFLFRFNRSGDGDAESELDSRSRHDAYAIQIVEARGANHVSAMQLLKR